MIEINGYYWPDSIRLKDVDFQLRRLGHAVALVKYCTSQDVIIQAGSCVGLYPIEQQKFFKQVLTFEPERENYLCTVKNVSTYQRKAGVITCYNNALSSKTGFVTLEKRKYATHRIVQGGMGQKVRTKVLDKMKIEGRVSAMQLDLEGYEYEALKGAENIIQTFRPVIQMESLDGDNGDAERFVLGFGYRKIDRQYGRDKIYVPA